MHPNGAHTLGREEKWRTEERSFLNLQVKYDSTHRVSAISQTNWNSSNALFDCCFHCTKGIFGNENKWKISSNSRKYISLRKWINKSTAPSENGNAVLRNAPRLYRTQEKAREKKNGKIKIKWLLSDKDQIYSDVQLLKWVRGTSNADRWKKPKTKWEAKKYWLKFNWPQSFRAFSLCTSAGYVCVCVSLQISSFFFFTGSLEFFPHWCVAITAQHTRIINYTLYFFLSSHMLPFSFPSCTVFNFLTTMITMIYPCICPRPFYVFFSSSFPL